LAVAFLPTSHEEAAILFPAVLTLSGAWLLAMPAYSLAISNADYSIARPRGALRKFLEAIRAKGLELPPELSDEGDVGVISAAFDEVIPAFIPVTLLDIQAWVAFRALLLACLGILGVLVGPPLSDVHWPGGWSPVVLFIAPSIPFALVLLVSLLMPFITLAYLARLRLDRIDISRAATTTAEDGAIASQGGADESEPAHATEGAPRHPISK